MRTKLKNVRDLASHNKCFNSSVAPLVRQIFQSRETGTIGYVHTGVPHAVKQSTEHPTLESHPQSDRVRTVGALAQTIGRHELAVWTEIAFGTPRNTILVGEIGSGKTATSHAVLGAVTCPHR
jgi:hypothetical protein